MDIVVGGHLVRRLCGVAGLQGAGAVELVACDGVLGDLDALLALLFFLLPEVGGKKDISLHLGVEDSRYCRSRI